MALTTCKECKKEVSTEAKTCPHCGIEHPGNIDNNQRLVGAVVLTLLVILFIYIITRHEKVGVQYSGNTVISEHKEAVVAELDQEAIAKQPALEQPKPMQPTAKEASKPLEQPAVQTIPHTAEKPKQPEQEKLDRDNSKNSASKDSAQGMVLRMLEYALQRGELSHEVEIQRLKLQIENAPKPATGNKKAAKKLNARGLASSHKGDFKQALKMFEEANALDKSDVEIVNNLGFSYLKQGNLDSARQVLITALTLSPGRTAAWENLGEVFGAKGDVSKAVACFSNAYRFSKDRLKFHQYMKKRNQNEKIKNLIQARANAMHWAEKSYLNSSKNTHPKRRVRHIPTATKKRNVSANPKTPVR